MGLIMLGVRLIFAAAAMAVALGGCSSFSMPDWMPFKPAPPPLQTVQFGSEPPGAEVHTEQGQTCRTPCSLAVPPTSQSVSFAMDGFLPQTVQINLTPDVTPVPVEVALQSAAPPKPVKKPRPRKTVVRTKPAPKPAAATQSAPANPQPELSPFPPPPPANTLTR